MAVGQKKEKITKTSVWYGFQTRVELSKKDGLDVGKLRNELPPKSCGPKWAS